MPAAAAPPPPPVDEAAAFPWTIDDLAAHSGVPSRTIRFYQSKSILPKPAIRGRVAFYGEPHTERLGLIARLQDRGLSIKAIRDLIARIDAGILSLDEWLGIEQELETPWSDDSPQLVDEAGLLDIIGARRPGLIGELADAGLISRQGDRYLVPSPALLRISLQLDRAGIPLNIGRAGADLVRKALEPLARELVRVYVQHFSGGSGSDGDVAAALRSLRGVGREAVQLIFGQAMERAIRQLVESGRLADIAAKRKKR